MCVAFLPFPSSLLGEYGGRLVAVEIYAGGVAATGLFLCGMWWYATRDGRLTDGDLDPGLIRHVLTVSLRTPIHPSLHPLGDAARYPRRVS
jgi:hypothetical protein